MRLSEGDGRKRFATVSEIIRLIAAAEKHKRAPYLADLIRVAVNTGCRRGELLGLRWEQVGLEANTLKLEGKDTKNGKPRRVPVNQQPRAALLNRSVYRKENCPESPWVFCHKSGVRNLTIRGQVGRRDCLARAVAPVDHVLGDRVRTGIDHRPQRQNVG